MATNGFVVPSPAPVRGVLQLEAPYSQEMRGTCKRAPFVVCDDSLSLFDILDTLWCHFKCITSQWPLVVVLVWGALWGEIYLKIIHTNYIHKFHVFFQILKYVCDFHFSLQINTNIFHFSS